MKKVVSFLLSSIFVLSSVSTVFADGYSGLEKVKDEVILSGIVYNNNYKNPQIKDEQLNINFSHTSNGIFSASDQNHVRHFYTGTGEMLQLDKKWTRIDYFSDELGLVATDQGKYGFIDINGKTVIGDIFDDADGFNSSKDRASTAVVSYNCKVVYINKLGKATADYGVPQDYEQIYIKEAKENYPNGMLKYGVQTKAGKQVIKPIYQNKLNFIDGISIACLNDKYGAIDITGKTVIEFKYDYMYGFEDGKHENKEIATVGLDGKYGAVNRTGNVVVPVKYDNYLYFYDGVSEAKLDGKAGLINDKGGTVVGFRFDEIENFYSFGTTVAKLNGKWGTINRSGETVIEFKYTDFKDWNSLDDIKYYVFQFNNKYGILDQTGKEVVPFNYSSINDIGYYTFIGNNNSIIDFKGNIIAKTDDGYNFISEVNSASTNDYIMMVKPYTQDNQVINNLYSARIYKYKGKVHTDLRKNMGIKD